MSYDEPKSLNSIYYETKSINRTDVGDGGGDAADADARGSDEEVRAGA